MASALRTAKRCEVEFPSSCPCDIYHPFQSLHKREHKSLTSAYFDVSQVPGSPALAALKTWTPRSRRPALEAAFHATFHTPPTRTLYAHTCGWVTAEYQGLYKCTPYCDLGFSLICVALVVVVIPISPRKRSVVISTSNGVPDLALSTACAISVCLSLLSAPSRSPSSFLEHPADCQCLDSGGYNLAAP